MRIVLVVDKKNNWSVHNRAKAIKNNLPDWHFKIKDFEELTPQNLNFYFKRNDIIHFCSGGIARYKYWFEQFPKTMTTALNSHGAVSGIFADYDEMEFIFKNSARVVALNKKLAKCFTNCVYIPNGVDVKLFNPGKRKKLVVGFAGIRTEAKGFPLIKRVCEEMGDYVKFIDDGNNHPDDFVPHEEMAKFYQKIDVLALASDDEGSSNVMLEALACGKQVISTRVGNVDALPGVIVVDKTVEDIKEGIMNLLPDLIMQKDWTWEKIAKKYRKMWIEVYRETKDVKSYYYKRIKA